MKRNAKKKAVKAAGDLLINGANITKELESHFRKGLHDTSFLLHVPVEQYFDVNMEMIRLLVNKHKYQCIYLSLQRPYRNLASILKERSISIRRVWFIDGVSHHGHATLPTIPRCAYLRDGFDIDDLIWTVMDVIKTVKSKNKVLFLDSISVLSLYHTPKDVSRFAAFLSKTLKKEHIEWVIIQAPPFRRKGTCIDQLRSTVHRVVTVASPRRKLDRKT
ncbi:hypothetical protein HYU19_01265 [Candidatus Woesearchaeota archaeon]|nr:hypothetical protein [Candidatus Woesearchaeota archaeon]